MSVVFKSLNDDYNEFFKLLPDDWQQEIVPFWNDVKDESKIYVIAENHKIIGGGIVFNTCPPDLLYFKDNAQKWFDAGYLYIGFLWIAEEHRNKNLGSFWLEQLKTSNPQQNYWLIIEEERLHNFYQRNDFVLKQTISKNDSQEYLYTFKSTVS